MLIVSLSLCFQYSGCRLQPLVFSQQSSVFSLHPSIHPSIPPTHPSILEQICSKSLACLLAPSSHLVILSVHLIRSSSLHPASASVSVSVSVSVFPDDSGDELQRGRSHLGQPKKDGLALRLAHFGGSRGLVGQMSSLCLFVRFTRECLLCTLGRRLGASVSLFGPLLGALGDLLEASLGCDAVAFACWERSLASVVRLLSSPPSALLLCVLYKRPYLLTGEHFCLQETISAYTRPYLLT